MVGVTGSAFLGLTVACARCHDHKFDPISQVDFYAMQAVFRRRSPWRAQCSHQGRDQEKDGGAWGGKEHITKKNSARFVPRSTSSFVLLDEEGSAQVEFLQKTAGKGTNPKGVERGHLNDPGDAKRSHNLSGGTYNLVEEQAGPRPRRLPPGRQGTLPHLALLGKRMGHARARTHFINWMPTATPPRTRIAGPSPQSTNSCSRTARARWSTSRYGAAFRISRVHDLEPESGIVLRAGNTGSAVTADVILLSADNGGKAPTRPPALRPAVGVERNVESFLPRESSFRSVSPPRPPTTAPSLVSMKSSYGLSVRSPATRALGAKLSSSGNYANNPKTQNSSTSTTESTETTAVGFPTKRAKDGSARTN